MNQYRMKHQRIRTRQTQMSDCKLSGKMAAMNGSKTLKDNPYKEGSDQSNAWIAGFELYNASNNNNSK